MSRAGIDDVHTLLRCSNERGDMQAATVGARFKGFSGPIPSDSNSSQPLLYHPAYGGVLFGVFTDVTCSICTEEVGNPTSVDGADPNTGEEWVCLPCGHAHHMYCLATWCESSDDSRRDCSCPECRAPIETGYRDAIQGWVPPVADSWAARGRRSLRASYSQQFLQTGAPVSRAEMTQRFDEHTSAARTRDEYAHRAHRTAVEQVIRLQQIRRLKRQRQGPPADRGQTQRRSVRTPTPPSTSDEDESLAVTARRRGYI